MNPFKSSRLTMRRAQRIRYAIADLRSRFWTVLLIVAGMSISVIYTLVAGFYGAATYRYQKAVVDDSLPTLVVASCPEVTDERHRFTDERLRAISNELNVPVAFPKIELGVKISLNGQSKIMVPAEGTVPGDPALSGARLAWGHSVGGEAVNEILLSRGLLEKLGGTLGPSGPQPRDVGLEVSRTVGGAQENHVVPLRIAGLIRYQAADKVYVSLTVAEHLDQWCSNKINRMPSAGGKPDLPDVTYPHGYAYVPRSQKSRVPDEASQLRLSVSELKEVAGIEGPNGIWATPNRPNAGLTKAQLDGIDGAGRDFDVYASRVWEYDDRGRKITIEGIPPGDHRWGLISEGKPPAFGEVFAKGGQPTIWAGTVPVRVVAKEGSFPGPADCYCTIDTLNWLAFRPDESPVVRAFTLVQTGNLPLARRMEADYPGKVDSNGSLCWAVYEIVEAPQNAQGTAEVQPYERNADPLPPVREANDPHSQCPADRLIANLAGASARTQYGILSEGNVVLTNPDLSVSAASVRFVPEPLFRHLSGKQVLADDGRRTSLPCIHVAPDGGHSHGIYRIDGRRLDVQAQLGGRSEQFWFPDAYVEQICSAASTIGIAIWHSWSADANLITRADRLGLQLREVASHQPSQFSLLFPGNESSCSRYLAEEAQKSKISLFRGVLADLSAGDQVRSVLCVARNQNDLAGDPEITVSGLPGGCREGQLRAGACRLNVGVHPQESLPPGIALVDAATYRRLAFEIAMRDPAYPAAGRDCFAVHTSDVLFSSVRDALAQVGLTLQPWPPVAEEVFVKYKIQDTTRPDGSVNQQLLTVVGMTKPTFRCAAPALSIAATIHDRSVILEATSAQDFRRFEARLCHGRWIAANSASKEVVLPLATAKAIFPGEPAPRCVGRTVTIMFARTNRVSASEPPLSIPLQVVGLAEAETVFVPTDLVRQVVLWAQDKMIYNTAKAVFESPAEIYRRGGHIRCNFHAADSSSVASLVTALERMGYRTEHNLAEQDGLKKLAAVLILMVSLVVGGSLFSAVITVSITTMMNIRAKIWEIGILRAHGMGSWEIISIFCSQGAILGTAAALMGTLLVVLGELPLRHLIGKAIRLPIETIFTGSIFSLDNLWLFAIASAVAVAFSVGGVLLPAAVACRMSPARALQRGA